MASISKYWQAAKGVIASSAPTQSNTASTSASASDRSASETTQLDTLQLPARANHNPSRSPSVSPQPTDPGQLPPLEGEELRQVQEFVESDGDKIPEELKSPISLCLIDNPADTALSTTVNYEEWQEYLEKHSGSKVNDPFTGDELQDTTLHPNRTARALYDKFRARVLQYDADAVRFFPRSDAETKAARRAFDEEVRKRAIRPRPPSLRRLISPPTVIVQQYMHGPVTLSSLGVAQRSQHLEFLSALADMTSADTSTYQINTNSTRPPQIILQPQRQRMRTGELSAAACCSGCLTCCGEGCADFFKACCTSLCSG